MVASTAVSARLAVLFTSCASSTKSSNISQSDDSAYTEHGPQSGFSMSAPIPNKYSTTSG